jgi:hypothetical protein
MIKFLNKIETINPIWKEEYTLKMFLQLFNHLLITSESISNLERELTLDNVKWLSDINIIDNETMLKTDNITINWALVYELYKCDTKAFEQLMKHLSEEKIKQLKQKMIGE